MLFKDESVCRASILIAAICLGLGCGGKGSIEPTDTVINTDTNTRTDSGTDTATEEKVLDVYILAGQSNMDGWAWYTGLTPEQQLADPRVPLYWSGWGEFRSLQPATTGGNIYFGPEVTLGRSMAEAGAEVALVKHAVSGTDLAYYWYPGETPADETAGAGFVDLAETVAGAALRLDATGREWRWGGFVWMQGESDATVLEMANAYEDNLRHLVDMVRELTETPELPAAIGMISTEPYWTYADKVREAEQAVADGDPFIFTVETDDLPRNEFDLAHYDGVSTRVLGARFATALLEQRDIEAGTDAPEPAMTVTGGVSDHEITGTVGWEFTLDDPITLTDIGAYGTTYLYTSADLGIWDQQGDLILRANVPSWHDAPATSRDSFWYSAIEPVTLEAGTYRVGMVSWEGDYDQFLTYATGSTAEGVHHVNGAYSTSYWLNYPSGDHNSGSGLSYVGPSFLFVR